MRLRRCFACELTRALFFAALLMLSVMVVVGVCLSEVTR